MSEDDAPRRAGRPRRAGADAEILATTAALLREHRYEELTLDGIARRAGVAKTTLYRRWRSKGALAAAAIASALPPDTVSPDAQPDPYHLVDRTIALLSGDFGPVLAALAHEAQTDVELRKALLDLLNVESWERLPRRPAALPIAEVVLGALWFHLLVVGGKADPQWRRELLALVTPSS